MRKINNLFYSNSPVLDLHGMDREYARLLTKIFIKDNFILGNKKLVIIHGIGAGIIKNTVHETLRTNKYVKEFYLDSFNIGATLISLK